MIAPDPATSNPQARNIRRSDLIGSRVATSAGRESPKPLSRGAGEGLRQIAILPISRISLKMHLLFT